MRATMRTSEEGSALTELAIIAPLFILLVFWAQFFTDLGILRLKVDEASRFALWEMTAQRDPAAVASEVATKFSDLASPDQRVSQNGKPFGVLAFSTGIQVIMPPPLDQLDAQFSGTINNPEPGGGLMSQLLGFLNKFLNQAVDKILKAYKFNTKGEAQVVSLQFRSRNTLFPGGKILGIDFSPTINTVTMNARPSPKLLVNTWKAWPGKFASSNTSVETDPYQTYGKGSAPEKEVGKRMEQVAFFGLGGLLKPLDQVLKFIKLPPIASGSAVHDWSDNGGPIVMLPGDRSLHSWSTEQGKQNQRIGDTTYADLNPHVNVESPDRNFTDRARLTMPGSGVETVYWKGLGGRRNTGGVVASTADTRNNPYKTAFGCRDGYYMGGTKQGDNNPRWGKSFGQWAQSAYPKCP